MKQMRNLTLKYVHLEKLSCDGTRPKVNPKMRPFYKMREKMREYLSSGPLDRWFNSKSLVGPLFSPLVGWQISFSAPAQPRNTILVVLVVHWSHQSLSFKALSLKLESRY